MIPSRVMIAYAVPLVLVAGGIATYTHQQREIGRRDVLLAQSRHDADSLKTLSRQSEVRFRTDTIRLRQMLTRTDSLHDSVFVHLTDTVKVKEYIVAADSTIKVCRATLTDCAKGWDTAKRQVSVLESQVRLLEAERPSGVGKWVRYGIAAGLGYAVGRLPR